MLVRARMHSQSLVMFCMGWRQAFAQRHVPAEGLQSTMLQLLHASRGHALNMHSTSRVSCRHVTKTCVFQAARIGHAERSVQAARNPMQNVIYAPRKAQIAQCRTQAGACRTITQDILPQAEHAKHAERSFREHASRISRHILTTYSPQDP